MDREDRPGANTKIIFSFYPKTRRFWGWVYKAKFLVFTDSNKMFLFMINENM